MVYSAYESCRAVECIRPRRREASVPGEDVGAGGEVVRDLSHDASPRPTASSAATVGDHPPVRVPHVLPPASDRVGLITPSRRASLALLCVATR